MRKESYTQQPSGEREAVERWENEGGKFRQQHGWSARFVHASARAKKDAISGLINSNEMKKLLRRRHFGAYVPVM